MRLPRAPSFLTADLAIHPVGTVRTASLDKGTAASKFIHICIFCLYIKFPLLTSRRTTVPPNGRHERCIPLFHPSRNTSIARPSDSFWQLLAYCAGVGGSMLIIGSAAGVVVMGLEKITFGWYMKHISWIAFVGYIAGIVCYWFIRTFLYAV